MNIQSNKVLILAFTFSKYSHIASSIRDQQLLTLQFYSINLQILFCFEQGMTFDLRWGLKRICVGSLFDGRCCRGATASTPSCLSARIQCPSVGLLQCLAMTKGRARGRIEDGGEMSREERMTRAATAPLAFLVLRLSVALSERGSL